MTNHKLTADGLVIHGDAFDITTSVTIDEYAGTLKFPLIIADVEYGGIIEGEPWEDVADYDRWFEHCVSRAAEFATIICWGGVGKPGDRPFLEWVSRVEKQNPQWSGQFATWCKKRGYGKPDSYLFNREEVFILSRGPRGKTNQPTFNKPYLEEKRGYSGFLADYPTKDERKRRTLIWNDFSDMLQHKLHRCQKPQDMYEMLITTHSNPGDIVYDPCAGSGTTARACKATGRKFVIVEGVRDYLEKAGLI